MKAVEPKRYRARFIEPGVISYEDVGQGLLLVTREVLDQMRPSFVGKPVFNFSHNDIDPVEAFEFDDKRKSSLTVGMISAVGTDPDGWDWADMMVWDEETQKNIDEKGFSISCAYDILDLGGSGKYNGIKYDDELTKGEYVHMAVVDNPRYSGSTIVLNSKGGGILKTSGWSFHFGKKKNAEEPTKEEKEKALAAEKAKMEAAKKNAEDGEPEEGDGYAVIEGQKVPLSDLVEAYMAGKENADPEDGDTQLNADQKVKLPSGEMCTVGDMVKAWQSRQASKENEGVAEPGTEAGGDVIDLSLQRANSQGAPAAPARGAKREPANEHFLEVRKNATDAGAPPKPTYSTRANRIATGAQRYSSVATVKKEGE